MDDCQRDRAPGKTDRGKKQTFQGEPKQAGTGRSDDSESFQEFFTAQVKGHKYNITSSSEEVRGVWRRVANQSYVKPTKWTQETAKNFRNRDLSKRS